MKKKRKGNDARALAGARREDPPAEASEVEEVPAVDEGGANPTKKRKKKKKKKSKASGEGAGAGSAAADCPGSELANEHETLAAVSEEDQGSEEKAREGKNWVHSEVVHDEFLLNEGDPLSGGDDICNSESDSPHDPYLDETNEILRLSAEVHDRAEDRAKLEAFVSHALEVLQNSNAELGERSRKRAALVHLLLGSADVFVPLCLSKIQVSSCSSSRECYSVSSALLCAAIGIGHHCTVASNKPLDAKGSELRAKWLRLQSKLDGSILASGSSPRKQGFVESFSRDAVIQSGFLKHIRGLGSPLATVDQAQVLLWKKAAMNWPLAFQVFTKEVLYLIVLCASSSSILLHLVELLAALRPYSLLHADVEDAMPVLISMVSSRRTLIMESATNRTELALEKVVVDLLADLVKSPQAHLLAPYLTVLEKAHADVVRCRGNDPVGSHLADILRCLKPEGPFTIPVGGDRPDSVSAQSPVDVLRQCTAVCERKLDILSRPGCCGRLMRALAPVLSSGTTLDSGVCRLLCKVVDIAASRYVLSAAENELLARALSKAIGSLQSNESLAPVIVSTITKFAAGMKQNRALVRLALDEAMSVSAHAGVAQKELVATVKKCMPKRGSGLV